MSSGDGGNVVPFGPTGGGDGRGPRDPDLPMRVGTLEAQSARIEASLERLEAGQRRFEEAASEDKARLAAIEAGQHRLALDMAEMKGRFAGLEGRIGTMPTTLQLLGLFLAVFVAAGVFRFFEPRLLPPPATQTRTVP